jgi:prephenate dehydrogenase
VAINFFGGSYDVARMFDWLVIVGPGLIGGSLGMAVREKGLARRVVGVGRRTEWFAQAVAAAAKDLDALRNAWLNSPEWTKKEVLEFPAPSTARGCVCGGKSEHNPHGA